MYKKKIQILFVYLIFRPFISDRFLSFDQLTFLDEIYRITIGFLIFVQILGILRHLSFNYQLYVMRNTIQCALGGVTSCLFLLGVTLVAFASLQFVYLGSRVNDYRNMCSSLFSLLTAILSLAKLSTSTSHEETEFNNLIFVIFCLIVNLLLINLFISILNDTMTVIKSGKFDRRLKTKFDKTLSKHVMKKLRNMFVFCSRPSSGYHSCESLFSLYKDFKSRQQNFIKVALSVKDQER